MGFNNHSNRSTLQTSVANSPAVSSLRNGNQPSGTVAEVKAGEASVTSYSENEIKKTGNEEDSAVHIEQSGNDVVKKASELNIEERASGDAKMDEKEEAKHVGEQNGESKEEEEGKVEEKRNPQEKADAVVEKDEEKSGEQNGDAEENDDQAKAGEKRKAYEKADTDVEKDEQMIIDKKEEEKQVKKQKTDDNISQEAKKGPGRPKADGEKKAAAKKEKKVPAMGKTERKTRSQGAA
jgi:hypothetical protein